MGLGYGWLPTHLIDEELRDSRLLPVEFVNGNAYAFAPRLVTRLNRHRGRAVELLERELELAPPEVAEGAEEVGPDVNTHPDRVCRPRPGVSTVFFARVRAKGVVCRTLGTHGRGILNHDASAAIRKAGRCRQARPGQCPHGAITSAAGSRSRPGSSSFHGPSTSR